MKLKGGTTIAHWVKCFYCGKQFDRDKVPCVAVNSRRYAHKECEEQANGKNEDLAALEAYIKQLFNYETLPAEVNRQIQQFVKKGYTYTGILKSLKFFYEVEHGSKEKSGGRIGIVPYVYERAKEYYYNIWLAQQKNIERINETYIMNTIEIPVIEVHIPSPSRKPMKRNRRLFTFLEEGSDEV